MIKQWIDSYTELKDYIKQHSEIQISSAAVIIPDEFRGEFYRLFNDIRNGFVKERFAEQLADAHILGEKYSQIEKQLLDGSSLKTIYIDPALKWFLQDPVDGVSRKLFDLTFDFFQDKVTADTYEVLASEIASATLDKLFHDGYIRWTALSLIKMLEPKVFYIAPVADQFTDPDLSAAHSRPGYTTDLPKLKIADEFSLDMNENTELLPPNVIVYSERLGTFASISIDFHRVYRKLEEQNKKQEWFAIEELRQEFGIGNIWPELAIYLSDAAENLLVVAEYLLICRPDLTLTIVPANRCESEDVLRTSNNHKLVLKPRVDHLSICRGKMNKPSPNITKLQSLDTTGDAASPSPDQIPYSDIVFANIYEVGFDADKLEPVIEKLAAVKPVQTENQM